VLRDLEELTAGAGQTVQALTVSFVTAFLPTRWKDKPELLGLVHVSGTILNGMLELIVGLVLWTAGLFTLAFEVHEAAALEMAGTGGVPSPMQIAFSAMILVSHALRPSAMFFASMAFDGLIRIAGAVANQSNRGPWFVDLADWLWLKFRADRVSRDLAERIGPSRPDELLRPEASESGLLELWSTDDKPFSTRQVVLLEAELYLIASRGVEPRGEWEAYVYRFEPLPKNEVARGSIYRL